MTGDNNDKKNGNNNNVIGVRNRDESYKCRVYRVVYYYFTGTGHSELYFSCGRDRIFESFSIASSVTNIASDNII